MHTAELTMLSRFAIASLTLGLLSVACGEEEAAAPDPAQASQAPPVRSRPQVPPREWSDLEEADEDMLLARGAPMQTNILADVPDATGTGAYFLSGQPDRGVLSELTGFGIRSVIDLRSPEDPREYDESTAASMSGLVYHAVPIASAADLTDEKLDRLRALLNDPDILPVLVHDTDADRPGAVWLALRIVDDGLSEDEALAEARTAGLRSDGLRERVLEYARARKKN